VKTLVIKSTNSRTENQKHVYPDLLCEGARNMLIRVMYVSQAAGAITTTVTSSILETAKVHNEANGITGVLCQGQDIFIQVLEGERKALNHLLAKIFRDSRHKEMEIVLLQEVQERMFPLWAMAHVNISQSEPIIKLNHPEFDPFTATGQQLLVILGDLLEQSSPIS